MTIKEAREQAGLNRTEVSKIFDIPFRTLTNWELGLRKCPPYVERWLIRDLMEYKDKILSLTCH